MRSHIIRFFILILLGLFFPALVGAETISNDRVFAYAEANYPQIFTGTATAGQYQQYNYRYYPASGNYLAVDTNNEIFILGPYTGNVITAVGPVTDFSGVITAWEATQVTGDLWVFYAGGGNNSTGGPWVTDGTAAGTSLIKDIGVGSGSVLFDQYNHQSVISLGNGKVLFNAYDKTPNTTLELGVTDGTVAGTNLVKDIGVDGPTFLPESLTSLGNGKAVFRANDVTHGTELWVSDGTAAGTSLVKDIWPGKGSSISSNDISNPLTFISLGNGKLLFNADDGPHGDELWVTDGTVAGTYLVQDILPGEGSSGASSHPSNFASLSNGKVLFYAASMDSTGQRGGLWVSDGTAAGTNLVKNSGDEVQYYGHPLTSLGNGKVLFNAFTNANGYELWVSDGTAAGTGLVKDINTSVDVNPTLGSGTDTSNPLHITSLGNGKVLFQADDGIHGQELWVSDGTPAGTSLVKDINAEPSYPFPNSSLPWHFCPLGNGKALFSADDGIHGQELWVSDSTAAGTGLVKDINVGSNSNSPWSCTSLGNGKAFFNANDGIDSGQEMWISDGTAAGTSLFKDISLSDSSVVMLGR